MECQKYTRGHKSPCPLDNEMVEKIFSMWTQQLSLLLFFLFALPLVSEAKKKRQDWCVLCWSKMNSGWVSLSVWFYFLCLLLSFLFYLHATLDIRLALKILSQGRDISPKLSSLTLSIWHSLDSLEKETAWFTLTYQYVCKGLSWFLIAVGGWYHPLSR